MKFRLIASVFFNLRIVLDLPPRDSEKFIPLKIGLAFIKNPKKPINLMGV